jgi:hypothetical protein
MTLIPGTSFIKYIYEFDKESLEQYFIKLKKSYNVWSEDDDSDIVFWDSNQILKDITKNNYDGYLDTNELIKAIFNNLNKNIKLSLQWRIISSNINEEWILSVYFTQIPHIESLLYRKIPFNDDNLPSADLSYLKYLLDTDLADIVQMSPDSSKIGKTIFIYLSYKINKISRLKKLFDKKKIIGSKSYIAEFIKDIDCINYIDGNDNQILDLMTDKKSIIDFLKKCDRYLLNNFGENKLEESLKKISLSLDKWLE